MSVIIPFSPIPETLDPAVLDTVMQERKKALSAREWKFRLKGYGFGIKEWKGSQVLTRLPRGENLGVLPSELC